MDTSTGTTRHVGTWGSAFRVVLGSGFLVWAVLLGMTPVDALVGLVVFPVAVIGVLALRGVDASPLRLLGPDGHCLNLAVLVPVAVFAPIPWLVFIGASLLLASARGYGGCELFAISNWARRRDDQIACPVFHFVDVVEARRAGRDPAC